MASDTSYSVGTVTVSAGGTTVTGTGTSWAGKVYEGDLFHDPAQGLIARVTADATSNTELSINAWPGEAMSGDAYEILFRPDSVRTSERARRLLELVTQVANTGIGIDAFGDLTDRDAFDDAAEGFAFLSLDGDGDSITDPVVFLKESSASADWSDPVKVAGPRGRPGAGMMVAVSNEATPIGVGAAKITFRAPNIITLSGIRASLTTASSSGPVTVDVNVEGISILSTPITIDQGERTSVTAAVQPVIADPEIPDDAEITIDIDDAGTGAAGLKVTFIGTQD